jgi:alpha-amylase
VLGTFGAAVAEMGFRTMLAEGAKHVLGWKSPNYVYANAVNQKLRLLLRNYKIPSSFISLLKG